MNILRLFQSFQTPDQAIEYLEKVRWKGTPVCPYCGSNKISRHASGDRAAQRWQCQECTRAFAVTVGTIFHGTHIPLKNWFLVLALTLNAKKSMSAYQIARDLGIRRPTVWSMMRRIRSVIAGDKKQSALLYGIVEADRTYAEEPREGDQSGKDGKAKTGRGTSKAGVMSAAERGARAAAEIAKGGKLKFGALAKFSVRKQKHDFGLTFVAMADV